MKLTRDQIQMLINAAVTILLVALSLFGYTVTVLDPSKQIIVEGMGRLTAAVERNNVQLETLADLVRAVPRETPPPKVEPTPACPIPTLPIPSR
ncbi:MAG: hypothetical protein H5T59_01140 [Anaerolineae bacterium]|nr:hypothetical protein [Anaerolineae bacterium]